jgi:hypothetical protein
MLHWIFDKFSKTALWRWFAGRYIGGLTFRLMGYPKFPMEDFFDLVDLMSKYKNTVFCFTSSDYDSLASILIRKVTKAGRFSHAGVIYPGMARGTRALHMEGQGPICKHLLDQLRQIDYLGVVAVPMSPENYRTAVTRMEEIIHNKDRYQYDYEQRLTNAPSKLYCSEMVYRILDGLVDDPDLRARNLLGRMVFDPDQVLKIGKLIYTNHPKLANLVEK